jgi:F-type H+-transporting ATPase subunit delta
MVANPVARVYAEALFGIARDRSTVEDILLELQDFLELVRDNQDIHIFLTAPVIDATVKVGHLKTALAGRVSDPVADFLCLLVEKGRMTALARIVGAYRAMADQYAGRARVSVQTATPLADALRGEIEALLAASLEKQIAIEAEVEPQIMGGAVITIGDKVYDGSIKNRLSQFRKQIMRSGGYETQG